MRGSTIGVFFFITYTKFRTSQCSKSGSAVRERFARSSKIWYFESDALCCVHIVVSFCGCSPRLLVLCRQRCLRNLSSKCVPWNDGLLFGWSSGCVPPRVQSVRAVVCGVVLVGRSVSVAAPRGGGGAGSLSLFLLSCHRPTATARPTDRPTEECSPSASLCLSAGSPPGCYVRWRYPPPFSIWSSQRFTNRSAERKRWVPQTLMFSYLVLESLNATTMSAC